MPGSPTLPWRDAGRRRWGSVRLEKGVEMVMPGDNTNLVIDLITNVAIEEGQRFAIREGGRTVGAGTVTEIIE
ncbi:MAG: hypothetical protein KKD59_00835 [Acidobacteria bacterium]|nr:hypothetical protein [Acidobacteriota bacterium]